MLLQIKNLSVKFQNTIAVNNISLFIKEGETVCLVGESGSGKTMTALSILGLLPYQAKISGEIFFEENKIDFKNTRGRKISMIFQEPKMSLNPLIKVGRQIEEVLITHTSLNKFERHRKIIEALNEVHIDEKRVKNYPHELSGGQIQRVAIAIATILKPALLIADEPTTALDVTTSSKIIKLLKKLKDNHKLSILFITHDLALAYELADKIIVMKNGEIVEENKKDAFFKNPKEKYSLELIRSIPKLNI